ncbi:MAG: glycosyltransferase family 2 protein [Gemmatimonadaceae bacterium]
MRAAVALFAFNRPETTARVFDAIRAARPPRLFLVCDGARAERAGEAERCAEVRRLLDAVDWPCAVERDYAASNLGCRRRISTGIAWVFSRADEAIFLEDDTLPDASFFPYCDELLARYRDDRRVQAVSGNNMLGEGSRDGASYWFSSHVRIWGWASWKRAWEGYDVDLRSWPALKATPAWTRRTWTERQGWEGFFDDVKAGTVDTWDAQFLVHGWQTGALCAIPATNLVANLGVGAGATNTLVANFPAPPVVAMRFPLVHPARVAPDAGLDRRWVRRELDPASRTPRLLLRRAWRWLKARFSSHA